jgi:hypothetical protein
MEIELNLPGISLPSTFWSVITVISLVGWITAVAFATRRGFYPDGSLTGRQFFIWLGVFVILYLLWVFGVIML